MLEKGKELLTANVAEAAAQSGGNVAEPSARKVAKNTASPEKPASLPDIFRRQKRAGALTMMPKSADGEPLASFPTSKVPRLEYRSSSAFHAEPEDDAAQQRLQPAVPPQETQGSANIAQEARLEHLLQQLQSRQSQFPKTLIKECLDSISVLLTWKNAVKPTHSQRDAMEKLSSPWKVERKRNDQKDNPLPLQQILKRLLCSKSLSY